ncbi:TonB-dependent receptor [Bryobacter aggregatus]|uniref:TonB-dependent receptor n=1 Tax=Bryobacter aggregatus TaxID=360054 RepID=UPI00068D0D2F|nr:TonB-dependent receptor [Bryobacter aggregatus]
MFAKLIPLSLLVLPLWAQTFTGAIGGRVTDDAAAAVPNARITITEIATNAIWKTESNSTGDYLVSFLKPGEYNVVISVQGFKEHRSTNVPVQLNQQVRINAQLQIGEVSEKVEVSASSVQLDFVSPEIGHVVGEQQLMNIPLLGTNSRGRSPLLLAKMVPGVTSTSANNSNINNFSFGGGRPVTNEILVDGLPTTNPSDQTYTLTPSPDSVQEFKVITTPFSAEWGHTGGGVMLLTSKTGTNELHGSAFNFFRNRVLNARNYFAPNNLQKYVQNNPGATLSGPVLIPKLYNGRDKTFFFTDFNVTLSSTGNVYNAQVPTAAERSGDFSQTMAGGKPIAIYDPQTRAPFPGNRIPASRIDPVAAAIVKYYPNPNGSFGGSNNYSVNPPQGRQVWQTLTRVDHNFSSNDKGFVRFGRYNPNGDAQPRLLNNANNDTASGFRDTQVAVSETHVFGPHVVNELRAGFVQEVNYTFASGGPAGELGLKGVPLTSFPIVKVDSLVQLGSSPSNNDRNRSWVFSEALTFQNGRHTLKMGGDYRRQMYNFYNPGKMSGTYSFGNIFTSSQGVSNSGFGLADLLIGAPQSTQIQMEDYTYRLNINSAGIYLQDDFKLSSRLTLNLGLRWEFNGPYSEANNQFASFNPNLQNRTVAKLGEVEFAGRNGAPRHFVPNIYYNFLPRVGFAWNFAPKTVLRGGYGVYRLPSIGYASVGPVSQYSVRATFTSLDNNITPRYYLKDGVPAYSYNVDPSGLPYIPASLTAPTSSVTALDSRNRTPYNQTWQMGIQRELPGGWFLETDYVATKGTKLPIALNMNQLRSNQFGAGNLQSLRPFPQYSGASILANDGNSSYHSLQAKLEHRWKNGLLVSAAYTFSKLLNDVDGPSRSNGVGVQDVYNLKAERGVGGYDVPQRFVVNYVYQLPFGRGGKYLSSTPVLKDLVGGWQFAGLTELQVGLPMSITQNNTLGGFTAVQRPNQIAGASLDRGDRTLDRWFNTAAFTTAQPYQLGNASRFPLHGPGINNTDLSLMRNFHFRERAMLQFRGEFYNAFNHPNFRNPGTNLSSPQTFGKITGAQDSRVTEFALRLFF